MRPAASRDELEAFLHREFPGALPLSRYPPFDMPAIVSFEPDHDLASPEEERLEIVAERVAQVYELVFAPGDRGWLCAVKHAALQAVLPEARAIEDVMSDGRVDLEAFVPQPVRPPDLGDLSVLIDALPPDARAGVSMGHGHDPLYAPEFEGLCDEEGVPYVDLVVRVRPRAVDYRSLIRAVVNQDFPEEGTNALDRHAVRRQPGPPGAVRPARRPLVRGRDAGRRGAAGGVRVRPCATERVPAPGDGARLRLVARAVAVVVRPLGQRRPWRPPPARVRRPARDASA